MGESFAIPTKSQGIKGALAHWQIKQYVEGFLAYAYGHPELEFQVTCIGCGLAGLLHKDIAPMFLNAPLNCSFDELWKPYLGDRTPGGYERKYWGSF